MSRESRKAKALAATDRRRAQADGEPFRAGRFGLGPKVFPGSIPPKAPRTNRHWRSHGLA